MRFQKLGIKGSGAFLGLLLLVLGAACVSRGATPEGQNGTGSIPESYGSESLDSDPKSEKQSDNMHIIQREYLRTDTEVIENYKIRGSMKMNITHQIVGNNSYIDFYFPSKYEGNKVTDINVSWMGSGDCEVQGVKVVDCADDLTSIQISYNRHFTPTVKGVSVYIPVSHQDNGPNYSLDLFYPSSLVYISSTLTPDLDMDGHLRWNNREMHEFETQVIFRDQRLITLRWLYGAGAVLAVLTVMGFVIWIKRRNHPADVQKKTSSNLS